MSKLSIDRQSLRESLGMEVAKSDVSLEESQAISLANRLCRMMREGLDLHTAKKQGKVTDKEFCQAYNRYGSFRRRMAKWEEADHG